MYYHFSIANGISEAFGTHGSVDVHIPTSGVDVQINIDGLPLYRSSKTQFWPILGRILQPSLPPFIIGLFSGQQKPDNLDEYLHDFVAEMRDIEQHGALMAGSENRVCVQIYCSICDAPARAFVKRIKGHNAYHGCERCDQHGVWRDKVTFPHTNAPLRSDESFNEMIDDSHHLPSAPTPLRQISIGLVSQFVLDPMHLVYLGVVKKLLGLWIKGRVATNCRIGNNGVRTISEVLVSFHSYIPREFPRKCRSLSEVDRWKATEFRQFILYSGVVALKKNIPDAFYKHFLHLFVGIFCLCSPIYCDTHCDYANELLLMFVNQFGDLYGKNTLVYNVHNLIYLASDARRFASLLIFCFPL